MADAHIPHGCDHLMAIIRVDLLNGLLGADVVVQCRLAFVRRPRMGRVHSTVLGVDVLDHECNHFTIDALQMPITNINVNHRITTHSASFSNWFLTSPNATC